MQERYMYSMLDRDKLGFLFGGYNKKIYEAENSV